jgi:nucleotide-binding universal stress UspA family protein
MDFQTRVLIVVDGHEPAGWARKACRAVALFNRPIVQLLAIVDIVRPPFTSLTPYARREYATALSYWREQKEASVQIVIDEIVPFISGPVDLITLRPAKGRLQYAIAQHVKEWRADAVVIAAPTSGTLSRLCFGPAFNALLPHTTCSVMVIGCGENASKE